VYCRRFCVYTNIIIKLYVVEYHHTDYFLLHNRSRSNDVVGTEFCIISICNCFFSFSSLFISVFHPQRKGIFDAYPIIGVNIYIVPFLQCMGSSITNATIEMIVINDDVHNILTVYQYSTLHTRKFVSIVPSKCCCRSCCKNSIGDIISVVMNFMKNCY
jgi:hypothetical protein